MDIEGMIIGGMSMARGPSVAGHYGMSEDDFDQYVKDILCSIIQNDKKSDVLDKFFPKLNEIDRAKVYAFTIALIKAKRIAE